MKKIFLLISGAVLFGLSCNKSDKAVEDPGTTQALPTVRQCASYDVLQEQLKADPTLAQRMQAIENFTSDFERNPNFQRGQSGTLEVPVVVNVLYRTNAENVSMAQIQSQID